jgi:regulator of sigma E protease
MLALISMNLAIMNILPVPLLDGGHLLFLGIEKLRGKPLSKEVQGTLGLIFMFLLFGLMFLGLYNDIFKPIGK